MVSPISVHRFWPVEIVDFIKGTLMAEQIVVLSVDAWQRIKRLVGEVETPNVNLAPRHQHDINHFVAKITGGNSTDGFTFIEQTVYADGSTDDMDGGRTDAIAPAFEVNGGTGSGNVSMRQIPGPAFVFQAGGGGIDLYNKETFPPVISDTPFIDISATVGTSNVLEWKTKTITDTTPDPDVTIDGAELKLKDPPAVGVIIQAQQDEYGVKTWVVDYARLHN